MTDTRLVGGRAASGWLAAAEPQATVAADSANATAEMVKILEILVPRMSLETLDCAFWLRGPSAGGRVKPALAASLYQTRAVARR
jgi:hypothetical protein